MMYVALEARSAGRSGADRARVAGAESRTNKASFMASHAMAVDIFVPVTRARETATRRSK